MEQTITITTQNLANELNKWQLTNHNQVPILLMADDDDEIFDSKAFDETLKMVSRKISAPVEETK